MAYSEASFAELKKRYSLVQDFKDLGFENVDPVPPSQRLQDDIEEGQSLPLISEKAKSEFLIAPIFKEIKRNHNNITLFSGVSFGVKNDKYLQGKPDYLLSAKPRRASVEAPIFCMIEAKNGIIEEGYPQCAAEMYAAQKFNQEMEENHDTIYGAVTNAFDWVFLKLEEQTVWIDSERFYLNRLDLLLGIFKSIIQQSTLKE